MPIAAKPQLKSNEESVRDLLGEAQGHVEALYGVLARALETAQGAVVRSKLDLSELSIMLGVTGPDQVVVDHAVYELKRKRAEYEVVGWRPMWPDEIRKATPFTLGQPSPETVAYWRSKGTELEWCYVQVKP